MIRKLFLQSRTVLFQATNALRMLSFFQNDPLTVTNNAWAACFNLFHLVKEMTQKHYGQEVSRETDSFRDSFNICP